MDQKAVIEKLKKGFINLIGNKGFDMGKIDILCLCQAASLPAERPVKIEEAAKQMGLAVYSATLPMGVSGMLNVKDFEICLEKSEPVERQRFTCAHEIGHFILHETLFNDTLSWGDIFFRSDSTSRLEREANSMAAEILMPMYFLEKFTDCNKTVADMASIFKVSGSAINCRISALGHDKAKLYWERMALASNGDPTHSSSGIHY